MRSKSLCSVVSAGSAIYGRRKGLTAMDLLGEAIEELFSNCPKLERKKIGLFYVGQSFDYFEHQGNLAAQFANEYGMQNIPSARIETVSSSGASSLREGVMAISSGMFDLVLCAGVEKMTDKETSEALEIISMAADRPYEQWNGATLNAFNAIAAREHMRMYGTTEEQLALVAVKNHRNAMKNPKAYLKKEIYVKDVLESRSICSPLKLYDCSPICDGAACVALCKPEMAQNLTDSPIDVVASTQASDTNFVFRDELTGFKATRIAVGNALASSEAKISDFDFLELHDAFTINEIIAYEDIGLCEKGKGGKLLENGSTKIDGEMPVNPSGGLKAKGHPVGATGMGQAYEVYSQMNEMPDPTRLVKDARLALTHSMGGAGVTVEVHVFKKRT